MPAPVVLHGLRRVAFALCAVEAVDALHALAHPSSPGRRAYATYERARRRCASLAVVAGRAPPPDDVGVRGLATWLLFALADACALAPKDRACLAAALGTPGRPRRTLRFGVYRTLGAHYVAHAAGACAHEHTFPGLPWDAHDLAGHAAADASERRAFAHSLSGCARLLRVRVHGRLLIDAAVDVHDGRVYLFPMHRVLPAPLPALR
jgi:hypothetical protein